MGDNLDSLLAPGPRLSDAPPTHHEEVVRGGLTLEDRLSAEDRDELLNGPLYGWAYPVSTGKDLASTPMRYTQEFIERRHREGQRTVVTVWLTVLAAMILGALLK